MNSQEGEEENLSKERKLLVKFGSILKKRIIRWYRLNSEKSAIEYYKDKNSPRLKGRIDVTSIAVIRMSSETTEKYILQRKSNERSITVWLSSAKIVYLFEKDRASAESLMRLLYKLMAKTNKSSLNLPAKIMSVSKQQRILEQQPLKDIQTTNPQADHLDLSDVNALMPESVSQRAKESSKGSFSVISDCGGECVPPISDETSKRIPHLTKNGQQRKHNAENAENIVPVVSNAVKVKEQNSDTDSEAEFERYVKYNEEIREALSKEETENTIRARVFSKYTSSNEPFQIAKIKRQIYSSSQSLTKSQAQKDSSFAINNNNNNNPFNFITLSSLNQPRNANTSIDQNKFGFTLPSPQLASPQQASTVFSPRILETNSPVQHRQSDENDNNTPFRTNQDLQKTLDISEPNLNASPAPHYETQETPHYTATLRKFDEAEFSIQADTYHNLTSNTKNNRKDGFTSAKNSISDIETESNLASIKQFQGDMIGKHSLQDTFTQELRGYFKAQTYFYQEFNTLISLNTQYLGGTNPSGNNYTNNNKKNTIVSSNNANYNPSNTLNHSVKQKEGYQTTLFNLTSISTDGMISEKQRKKIQGDNIEVTARNMKIYEVPSENSVCSFSDEQEIFSEKEIDRVGRLVESYSHSGRMVNCFKSTIPEIKVQQMQQLNSSNSMKNGRKKIIHPRIEQVPIERYQLGKLLSDGFVLLEPESRVIVDSSDDVSRVEEQMKFMEVATRSVKMKSEPDFLAANPIAKAVPSPQQLIRSPSVGLNRRNSSFLLENTTNNNINNNNNTVTNNNNNLNASFGNNDASALLSPSFSSQQRQCSPAMSSPEGHKLWPEENEDDFQNLDNSPNVSIGKSLQLGINFLLDFKFSNAQITFDQSRGTQDADIILGQIYILLVQFFFSLRTELLEIIIKLCEHGVDVTLALRARKNIFLFLAQDAYLAEIYLIKGIILFALDKKIQSLLSFKNAYKYFERCLSAAPEVSSLLTFYHKSKIDLLEGLYNIAACTLQESYRKVLLFFGQKFDSQRGLQILSFIANKQYSNAQYCPPHLTQQLAEYMRSFHDKANVDIASHIATCSLGLYHIWREKNAIPVAKLISAQLKQYSSSPIYLWLSYLVNFERKDNVKALGQLNKALLKCHAFRPQNIAFKFEKAGFLASNMLWRESSLLFGCITVQLLSFDGFKTEHFKAMLLKQGLSGFSLFSAFYRSKQLEFKSEKIFFTGISNVLLSYAATLIGIGDIPQAKECLLLSPYFKKHSYLNGFINQDMHLLSLIFIKRRNFNLVKFEIMYFTKIITKVPLELIKNMLQEVESHRETLFSAQIKTTKATPSETKSLAVEQASYILLRILAGCLQCDSQIIQECETQLGTIVNFTTDKKLAENAYLLHHSYYWISKFYLLSNCYASALNNLKNMAKYPSKIFSLQQQADGILKDIEARSPNVQ